MSEKQSFLEALVGRMSLADKVGQLNLLAGTMAVTGTKESGGLEAKVRTGECGAVFNVYTPGATRALQELALESPHRIAGRHRQPPRTPRRARTQEPPPRYRAASICHARDPNNHPTPQQGRSRCRSKPAVVTQHLLTRMTSGVF